MALDKSWWSLDSSKLPNASTSGEFDDDFINGAKYFQERAIEALEIYKNDSKGIHSIYDAIQIIKSLKA